MDTSPKDRNPQESFKPTSQITERRMSVRNKEEEVTPIRASMRGSLGSRAKVKNSGGKLLIQLL